MVARSLAPALRALVSLSMVVDPLGSLSMVVLSMVVDPGHDDLGRRLAAGPGKGCLNDLLALPGCLNDLSGGRKVVAL